MRKFGYRAGRAGSHLCSAPADTADETGSRDLALQTGSRARPWEAAQVQALLFLTYVCF